MPRDITSNLKTLLQKRYRTPAENADPKLEVIISRAKYSVSDTSRFQVDTIREKAGLGDIGLDLKRENTDEKPTYIYEVHNDNDEIRTATRKMPATPDHEWIDGIKIDDGDLCRLIFNGGWNWSERYNKYIFVTNGDPFLFYTTAAGTLKTQTWEDSSDRQDLATDVVSMEAVRGWKSKTNKEADQGLIIAYIKTDGNLYYRAYEWDATTSAYIWKGQQRVYFAEQPEIDTLNLEDSSGGTYELGTSTLNWNDDAATIQAALESEYGAGQVSVEEDSGNFIITFAWDEGTTGLTFDETNLTGYTTTPTLTITTAYNEKTADAVKVSFFRTTDYRLGFVITSDDDEVFLKLTDRQWAGMGIRPEAAQMALGDIAITRTKITFIENTTKEAAQMTLGDLSVSRLFGISPTIEAAQNIDDGSGDYGLKIEIEFNEDLYEITDQYSKFTITDEDSVTFAPTAIAYKSGSTKIIILTVTDFNGATGDITITYTQATGGIEGEAGQALETQSFDFTPTGLVPPVISAPTPTGAENVEGEEL